MATDDTTLRQRADEVIDLTEDTARAAASWAREAGKEIAERAHQVAASDVVRSAPFAAVGLGDVVVEAARDNGDAPLPDRLRRTPGAVVSKVRDLGGEDARATYLGLAERGRVLRGKVASDPRRGDVDRHAKAARRQADVARSAAAKVGTTPDTGTGPLEQRTVAQLRARASELEIEGRSGMQKKDLIEAIRDAT